MGHPSRLQGIFDSRQAIESAWAHYVDDHRHTFGHSRGAKAARTVARRAFDLAATAIKDLATDELRVMERKGQVIDWQGLRPRHSLPATPAPSWSTVSLPKAEAQCE